MMQMLLTGMSIFYVVVPTTCHSIDSSTSILGKAMPNCGRQIKILASRGLTNALAPIETSHKMNSSTPSPKNHVNSSLMPSADPYMKPSLTSLSVPIHRYVLSPNRYVDNIKWPELGRKGMDIFWRHIAGAREK